MNVQKEERVEDSLKLLMEVSKKMFVRILKKNVCYEKNIN